MEFLRRNWAKLKVHFLWYRGTQKWPLTADGAYERSYRWAGRTAEHNLPSGLDDYPRFEVVVEDGNEGHVDIHCWMVRLHRVMADFADAMGETEEATEYRQRGDDLAA